MGSTSAGRQGGRRGPQNLSRAKTAVHKMMQQLADDGQKGSSRRGQASQADPREAMFRGKMEMSRKERRKMVRRARKAQTNTSQAKQSVAVDKVRGHPLLGSHQVNAAAPPGKNREKNKRKKRNRRLKEKEEQERAVREEELAVANKEDERTIRQLEKDMHFRKNKKTKTKITPSIFKAEGLDYLLDLVNADSEDVIRDGVEEEDVEDELDGEFEDESDSDKEQPSAMKGRHGLLKQEEEEKEEEEEAEEVDEDGEPFEEDAEEDSSDDSEDNPDRDVDQDADSSPQPKRMKPSKRRQHPSAEDVSQDGGEDGSDSTPSQAMRIPSVLKMDPYGNLIGEEGQQKVESYVPPQKRAKMMGMDAKKQEQLDRLRKQLKGFINRLSESNIQSISKQVEELYLTNSRNDMNETLAQLIQDACVGPILTGERLVMEHVMLIAVLNVNVGIEVGAHFIESLAGKLDELYKEGGNYGNGKQCDNIILLFTHLYNFKVIHCTLVYDIVHKLVDGFTERDIEMLLLILKSVGLMLRKDDPSALKEIITQIQTKAATCSDEFKQQSRVKFMLETIYAIRNNNVRKIPNYDPAQLDHMRKVLRSLIKAKGHTDSDATMRISLESLLSTDERGRWWIVGSSWAGHKPAQSQRHDTSSSTETGIVANETSNLIAELSRQQRMNTDLRKAIFNVIMTAEDYLDAYEKMLRLSLKAGQEREVIHVVINCCLQEVTFNPYYAHLGNKLSQHDRKYKMAFQFAFWDKFKILGEMTGSNRGNLAQLLSLMLLSKALSIAVLKVIEFGDIEKVTVGFLRQTLRSLLLASSQEAIVSVFSSVTSVAKLQFFREGLRLFLHHFVLPKKGRGSAGDEENDVKLKERVQLASQILAGEDYGAKF